MSLFPLFKRQRNTPAPREGLRLLLEYFLETPAEKGDGRLFFLQHILKHERERKRDRETETETETETERERSS